MARKDPDFQAAQVAAEALESEEVSGAILVAGDPTGYLDGTLGGTLGGAVVGDVTSWSRRAGTPAPTSAFPPDGPFDVAVLKIPKSAEELKFTIQLLTERLAPDGRLYVYGANDEGIKSAAKAFAPFYSEAETLATKRHSRVWGARRLPEVSAPDLSSFKEVIRVETKIGDLKWTSWPGMFAHRRLDVGTEFLLDHLPDIETGTKVLDYGCGAGVLSLALRLAGDPNITLLDNDALALETALQNVPGALGVLGTSLAAVGDERYDLILSNPPIHDGKKQTYAILERLVTDAPNALEKGGKLRIVVQGTVPVERWMEPVFKSVSPLANNGSFAIWEGRI